MKKICILVNRIWEFIQHSQTIFIQKRMTISLSFSVWDSKDHNRKIWIQNYKILLLTKYTTKQYACVYPLHLLNMDLQVYFFIEIDLREHFFFNCSCDLFPFSSAPRISWGSGACAVFCHDANLVPRLCSSPLIYCFVFLFWSNSSWPSFNLLIPFLSLQTHYWSALVSFGFRFLHHFYNLWSSYNALCFIANFCCTCAVLWIS